MKISFMAKNSREIGLKLSGLFREFIAANNEACDTGLLKRVSKKFDSIRLEEDSHLIQEEEISGSIRDLLMGLLSNLVFESNSETPADSALREGPVVLGHADGLDCISTIETDEDGNLELVEINVDSGGLGANTATALKKQGIATNYLCLNGQGPIAEIQASILKGLGVESTLIETSRDTSIHPCFHHLPKRGETWLVQDRFPISKDDKNRFTDTIKKSLENQNGEFLILACVPPAGAGDDYFAELAELAYETNNISVYNPKDHEQNANVDRHLLNSGKLNLTKPTQIELLKMAINIGMISEDSFDKLNIELDLNLEKLEDLSSTINSSELDEVFSKHLEITRELASRANIDIIILSLGKHGALLVRGSDYIYQKAPKIKLECSSGAGDSGLAGFISEAKNRNLDIRDQNLAVEDLEALLEAFVFSASATCCLPGNQIASLKEIRKLRESLVSL